MNITPHPKMANSGIAGACSVIIIWGISTFTHVVIPPEIASAITVVISFLTGYFTPASTP